MRVDPYYNPVKRHYKGKLDVPGFEPRDLIITVNGKEVLRKPIGLAAAKGWRDYPIPPKCLKRGKNLIDLKQARNGEHRLFYVAASKGSKGHSFQSKDRGRTFKPLPDELLIQIELRMAPKAKEAATRRRRFNLVTVPKGPRLTGDLGDPLWRRAARLDGFVTRNGLPSKDAPTEAFLLSDKGHLYVGFVCHEPRIKELIATCGAPDGPVWSDDCVELLLNPANGDAAMYHWIVNARGVIWDGFHGPAGEETGYNSAAEAKCSVGEDRWICELKVPFRDLPAAPQPGEVWGINVCRERKVGKGEISSWAPAQGNFNDPARLGEAVVAPKPGAVVVQILSRGGRSADVRRMNLNVFRVNARNTGGKPATVRLEVKVGNETYAEENILKPGREAMLNLAYELPRRGTPHLRYSVAVAGGPVYSSVMQALAPAPSSQERVWVVGDPLFGELLGREKPKADRPCAILWPHQIARLNLLRDTAKCLATRYVLDEMCREFAEHHLLVLGFASAAHVRGLPYVAYPANAPRGSRWILGPKSVNYSLKSAKTKLRRSKQGLWGVFAGDEVIQRVLRQGADLIADPPPDYPYIRQATESVKREFGGGRWGIPKGRLDRNPYRWIAFRRWCNARLRERHARLLEIVKRRDPELKILSTDPQAGIQSVEWSSQASCFDVFTHQAMPRKDANRAVTGFLTKLIADLTGKDFWPVVHIENYKLDATPEEAVEILSQVFRNGGTGFHLFLSDIGNSDELVGDTRLCYFGSPRRYHTIMNIVDLARTMPRPVYPAYERTAILFNDDTVASQPYRNSSIHAERTETCYMALGPVARSWFKFIDCAQALGPKDLCKRFDAIYLPAARYQRPEVVGALRRFVQAGGTLVCGDVSAFETDTLGNDTASARADIFGVDVGEGLPARKLVPKVAELGGVLPLKSKGCKLIPRTNLVEVLATYEDGSPAVTLNRFGKGRAILFGVDPFRHDMIADATWQRFYRRWVRWLGAPTDLKIWRFRFPDRVIWREPAQAGLCLTNNHVVWREERPTAPQNSGINGGYCYSMPPDAVPDAECAGGDIPFDKGHLTDRRRSIMAEKKTNTDYADYKLPVSRWTLSWSRPEPVSVTLDLTRTWDPLRVKLWFCDTLPDITVEGSLTGKTWRPLGRANGLQAGADVYDISVPLRGAPCRYVRITFAARPAGQRLTLVETEIWGQTRKRQAEVRRAPAGR